MKHKKIILTALIFPLILVTVSLLIGRNLFVEEWKEVIVCFCLYVGVTYLVYSRKTSESRS